MEGIPTETKNYINFILYHKPTEYKSDEELAKLTPSLPKLNDKIREKLEIEIKYEGYISIQLKEANRLKAYEDYINTMTSPMMCE